MSKTRKNSENINESTVAWIKTRILQIEKAEKTDYARGQLSELNAVMALLQLAEAAVQDLDTCSCGAKYDDILGIGKCSACFYS